MKNIIALTAACVALGACAKTEVEFLSERIVHVRKCGTGNGDRGTGGKYPIVTMKPQDVALTTNGNAIASRLVAVAKDETGNLTFSRPDGAVLLREKSSGFNSQTWQLDEGEAIYGLGIWQDIALNRRGAKKHMVNSNTEDYIPFFQSVKGYGVYWDNQSPTDFEDGADGTSFCSSVGDGVDYYFMLGDNFDGVVREMRNLTGRVPLMPKWTYGYWISRERYKSWDELLEVLDKHRGLGIPLDGIVQDWRYWGDDGDYKEYWNAMEFRNPAFAKRDAKEVVDEIHSKGAHLMITIWPGFGPKTKQYAEFAEKGMLMDFPTWPPKSGAKCYDVYNPVARDIYWKYLKPLFDIGVDAWWMDSTDPDHLGKSPENEKDFDCPTFLGPWRNNRNAFAIATVEGVYDHERAEKKPDKRVAIMTRSMTAGQQRTGANTWSGDVRSNWDTLRKQIPAGLGLTACGNPNFNSDGGGFFTRKYNNWQDGRQAFLNPRYRELYVRWMQFALFNPLMRSHGTETFREFYYYGKAGEPVYDSLVKAAKFRYRLLPYTYSIAGQMMLKDGSFMRPLAADFAIDPIAVTNATEFLYGPSLLVAPVAKAQYTDEKVAFDDTFALDIDWNAKKSWQVYLPAGADWWEVDASAPLRLCVKNTGGQSITWSGAIGDFPLFVRAGSIIPLGDDSVQFAAEQNGKPIDLAIFPGADGNFDFYDDAGDGYGYERGEYCLIPMHWDDAAQTLTLGKQKGTHKQTLKFRVFGRVVEYKGEMLTIKK